MRFQRGSHYPHPPRGKARKTYTMTDAALRQRCRNLRRTRLRSDRETAIIKLLIWQASVEGGARPSQRTLTRELGVWPSYVCKVLKQATSVGWEARVQYGRRVTLDDLADARRFTERIRQEEPRLLAPRRSETVSNAPRVMTADEGIAEQRRFAEEWKLKKPPRYDTRRRISVPIPR